MDWYVYVGWMLIVTQALFSLLPFNNYRYALAKYKRKTIPLRSPRGPDYPLQRPR